MPRAATSACVAARETPSSLQHQQILEFAKMESMDPGQGLELNIEPFSLLSIVSDLARQPACLTPGRAGPPPLPAARLRRSLALPRSALRRTAHARCALLLCADGYRRAEGDGQGRCARD